MLSAATARLRMQEKHLVHAIYQLSASDLQLIIWGSCYKNYPTHKINSAVVAALHTSRVGLGSCVILVEVNNDET